MSKRPGMKNTSVYIPIEMHAKFKEKAKGHQMNISQLLRELIESFNDDRLMIRKSTQTHDYRISN